MFSKLGLITVITLLPVHGQIASQAQTGLPIKRVVLYKNGVGYFEHVGSVRDNQSVSVGFTPGQLNDVLKSLTVLDLSGGRIGGITYGSAAPLERRLGDLQFPMGEKTSLTELLGGLRGARIEVRTTDGVLTGRLLSVERKTRISGGTTLEADYLALMGNNGDVRTTELSPSYSVRLLDAELTTKMARYLDLVSSTRDAGMRQMTISAEGSGERSLFVSYISEVPVWKATYRIVIDPKAGPTPLLQGWAIVDNTVGQDWENVSLSLIAGAPQSFVQDLSTPYYSRRPTIGLPEALSMSPQTHEAMLIPGAAILSGAVRDQAGGAVGGATVRAYDQNSDVLAAETTTNADGVYAIASLPEGRIRLEIQSPGFTTSRIPGITISGRAPVKQDATLQVRGITESVEVNASPMELQTDSSVASSSRTAGSGRALGSGRSVGGVGSGTGGGVGSGRGSGFAGGIGGGIYRAQAESKAAAIADRIGDLFEYKIKDPISIRKNQSALVPIVQRPVIAEKVSIWNEQSAAPRPQRALWLTNSSGSTLDGGSFSVIEDETFAGEGIVDPIRPGERRLISYAFDLNLTVKGKQESQQQHITRLRITRGMLTHTSEVREQKIYTVRNEDNAPRTVIIEHPVRNGYELRSETKPTETTSAWMRFRLEVPAKQTGSLTVEESRPGVATYALNNLTNGLLLMFSTQKSITPQAETSLRQILSQKTAISELEGRRSERDSEMDKIFDDQQRLRENMKALKGSAEEKALLQRYTQQLNTQESRLEALRKELDQLDENLTTERAKLDKLIQDLDLDTAI